MRCVASNKDSIIPVVARQALAHRIHSPPIDTLKLESKWLQCLFGFLDYIFTGDSCTKFSPQLFRQGKPYASYFMIKACPENRAIAFRLDTQMPRLASGMFVSTIPSMRIQ